MAATGYPLRRLRNRRPSAIELALALSVIAGLAFVSIRVKNMAPHEARAQATEQAVPFARAEIAPLAPDTAENKTP
jgi:hypothetical protein